METWCSQFLLWPSFCCGPYCKSILLGPLFQPNLVQSFVATHFITHQPCLFNQLYPTCILDGYHTHTHQTDEKREVGKSICCRWCPQASWLMWTMVGHLPSPVFGSVYLHLGDGIIALQNGPFVCRWFNMLNYQRFVQAKIIWRFPTMMLPL